MMGVLPFRENPDLSATAGSAMRKFCHPVQKEGKTLPEAQRTQGIEFKT